jgi:hypothetical protein
LAADKTSKLLHGCYYPRLRIRSPSARFNIIDQSSSLLHLIRDLLDTCVQWKTTLCLCRPSRNLFSIISGGRAEYNSISRMKFDAYFKQLDVAVGCKSIGVSIQMKQRCLTAVQQRQSIRQVRDDLVKMRLSCPTNANLLRASPVSVPYPIKDASLPSNYWF